MISRVYGSAQQRMAYRKESSDKQTNLGSGLTVDAPFRGTGLFSSHIDEELEISGPDDEELIWPSMDTTDVENGEDNV